MAKYIDEGLIPPDDPIFSGGWNVNFIHGLRGSTTASSAASAGMAESPTPASASPEAQKAPSSPLPRAADDPEWQEFLKEMQKEWDEAMINQSGRQNGEH